MNAGADVDLLAERLLRVIDEGRRTATYKLALLLALTDLVAANPGVESLATRTIAVEVLERYFRQVRPYVRGTGVELELRQISMKQSPVMGAARTLRTLLDEDGLRTIREVAACHPQHYERCVSRVEDTFVRYPIPLLQVVGTRLVPFLYEPDWGEGTSVLSLRRSGRDMVRLLPGVAEKLVVLGPLVRPLIELHWTTDVARWSALDTEDERLRTHLFGAERTVFNQTLRDGLLTLQRGACFYCGCRLGRSIQVDHFVAWSRWPNDAVENLVLGDRCNGEKSDHLAAPPHLYRWARRNEAHADDLRDLALAARLPTDLLRTWGLATTAYRHVSKGTPMWIRGRDFAIADGPVTLDPPPALLRHRTV